MRIFAPLWRSRLVRWAICRNGHSARVLWPDAMATRQLLALTGSHYCSREQVFASSVSGVRP